MKPNWMLRRCMLLLSGLVILSLLLSPAGPVQAGRQMAPIPLSGGTLRFPLIAAPVTLDPALMSAVSETAIALQIFEGLVRLDENNNVLPGIASSWSSLGAATWTFNLRPDVTFHNGRSVTAADFVYSWERARNAGGASDFLFDDILSFSAPDDYTFVVNLARPLATFPVRAAMPVFAVIPSEAAGTIGTNPVGTGAFKFVNWAAGKITLQKYADYYEVPAYLDAIEFKIYADTNAAWADFQAASLDLTPIPAAQWNAVKADPNVVTGTTMAMQSYAFDMSAFPDVRVRKAFQRAIDRAAIASLLSLWPYDPLPLANGVVSPGKGTYDNSAIAIPYNPTEALSLLASAGWTDTNSDGILDNGVGTKLTVVLQDFDSPGSHATALAIAADLTDIGGTGVGVVVTLTTDRNLATMEQCGWLSDYPAPDNDLLPFEAGGGFASRINYNSQAFDYYVSSGLSMQSEPIRNDLFYYADVQVVLNDAAILPLYYGSMTPVLKKPNLNNLVYNGQADSQFLLKHAWLAPTGTFYDVPDLYWARSFIERLYVAGVTGGCGLNPPMYCPEDSVTRAQMAVFLERGIHGSLYTPPDVGGTTGFADVSTTYWSAAWIKQLAADGITAGCGSGNYCPETPVTRAQMAVFLLKAKYSAGYLPPDVGTGTGFTDVPVGYWSAAWIKQLAVEGITGGCGNGNYCPEAPVTRAQMAVFLVKTFNLP